VIDSRSSNTWATVIQQATRIAINLGNRQIRPWGWHVSVAMVQAGGGLWMASRTKDPMVRAGAAGMVLGAVDTLASF